jgi:Flp pilus assembly protein TadG
VNSVPSIRQAMRGTAALEFALFAPLLLIMLVYVVELGDGVYEAMQVQNAAEAGALYVAKYGWNSAGISAAVVNSTGLSGLTASPAPSEFCGCPAANAIASSVCAQTCASGATAGTYVKINASLTHQTILALPGMVSPTTLTGIAIVRVN